MSKLTAKQTADIRQRHQNGESMASLARHYGMSKSGIQHQIEAERLGISQRPKAAPVRNPANYRIAKCSMCPLLFRELKSTRFCSAACYRRSQKVAEREFVAEVEWIAGTDTWENIAHRLGYKNTKSLGRRLFSIGEFELARQVDRVDFSSDQRWAA